MIPNFTVWQWDKYNGWQLFLGSASSGMAEQARRALALYQPQKWYQTYARKYALTPAFDVKGLWRGSEYIWGAAPNAETAWVVLYALGRILDPSVVLTARAYAPHEAGEVVDAMPSFARSELGMRFRYA